MQTILLVDDNAINRELATDLLAAGGFEVYAVDRAHVAIKMAELLLPDLILMDIAMPEIDGIEALRILKRNPETAGIPVAMLSAHAMVVDKLTAFESGCVAYMTKPIATRTFATEIADILRKRSVLPEAA